ncbi:ABC transporter substrate-binding protein, partial [Candidatus Bipolaricaulota bacterium]|nr:ABC transporter substrate-binding protein [Candidatus Bipolaricaulota bacterium]
MDKRRIMARCFVVLLSFIVIGMLVPAVAAEGPVLRIGTPYSIETLDPTKYSSDGDYYVLSQIYEPLVQTTLVEGLYVIPRLAESWENPDSCTWIFYLRDNMYWHDGNEVFPEGSREKATAEDVKFTYDFILDPANQARLQPKLASIIESVEVVDKLTVKFVTKEPYAFFLGDLDRVPVFSKKVYEQLGRESFATNPIGCGPFKFVEYRPDDRAVLVRNENFFIKPQLYKVEFYIIPDKMSLLMAL